MVSPPLGSIVWAPDPVMLVIGGRPLMWYALLFVGGLLGGYAILAATFVRERVDLTYANVLLLFAAIGAVVGGRLGEVFFYEWPYYRAHPAEIVRVWRGGVASHGAVIGIAVMVWLFARAVIGKPFLWVADRAVPGIALGAACIRFGNLINSEILGTPTSVPWAFVFQRIDAIPRHPVQVYEGIAYLVLCAALLVVRRRYALPEGRLTGLFFVGMFAPRWLLELTKDGPVLAAGMNTGQLLSLPLVVIGAAMLVLCRGRGHGADVRTPPVRRDSVAHRRRRKR